MRTGILLIFFFFFIATPGVTQRLDPEISETRLMISGASHAGFSTYFDQPANVIQKSWWRYAREFGRPLNMKTYYEVTIPSTENTGNVDLVLLSKTLVKGNGSTFFLTIADEQLPDNRKTAYREQVRLILLEFKRVHFLDEMEELIQAQEKKVKKLSKEVEEDPLQINVQQLIKEANELDRLKGRLQALFQY